MKKAGILLTMMSTLAFSYAQDADSTGLEGDNLDLNGVLELFQESEDIEDFEKKLNTESNGVNNLDLDGDGEVDYIRVVDHSSDNSHSFALQVPVSEEESQDVAVIEMDQVDDETVNLQVIGDAELYGEAYMVEPMDEKNPDVVVNVNLWRPVRHIYGPRYVPYVSPWRYRHHPSWYKPWKRVAWRVYHPRVIRYHRPYYRRAHVYRCHKAHNHYHKHHAHSPKFHAHHKQKHAAHNNNGHGNQHGDQHGKKSVGGKKKGAGRKKVSLGPLVNPNAKTQGAQPNKAQPSNNRSVTPTKRPGAVKVKGGGR